MQPLRFCGDTQQLLSLVMASVESKSRARVVQREGNYLHCEFRSLIFRFVDDVEFLVDESEQVLHFRSASRVGYWDLGANRHRMERLVRLIEEKLIEQEMGGKAIEQ